MRPAVEQRAIAVVVAAAAAFGDDAGVRLRVILVLVGPAIPPPHRSRERRLHPSRDDLPPLLTTTMHATRRALCVARTRGTRRRSRLGAAGSLSLREEEEEGGAWRRLAAAGGGWWQGGREGSGGGGGGVSLV